MTKLTIEDKRLAAAVRALYPWYEGWDAETQKVTQETVQKALEASDAVLFADKNVSLAYPYVYSFLKRRGLVPVGKEVESLVGYVVGALKGNYSVE